MKIEITNIEQLRKVKDISYKDIDKVMSRTTYRDIVTGKRPATEKSIEKITQIFKVEEKDVENLILN